MDFYVVVECEGEAYKPVSGLYVDLSHAMEHAVAEDHRGRRCYVVTLQGALVKFDRPEDQDAA